MSLTDTIYEIMLTGFNQSIIFKGIVKQSMTITKASDIPFVVRRAFRLTTCGKPGSVHIRGHTNALSEYIEDIDIWVQKDFIKYPAHRLIAEYEKLEKLLIYVILSSEKPLNVCGHGV